MTNVGTGYKVKPLKTGMDNLLRWAMVKRLRELVQTHEALARVKSTGDDVYGGYVFDYGHLSVTLEAPFIVSHDATPDELVQGLLAYINLPLEDIEAIRAQVNAHELEREKKVSTQ